jgi:hypothetical protein
MTSFSASFSSPRDGFCVFLGRGQSRTGGLWYEQTSSRISPEVVVALASPLEQETETAGLGRLANQARLVPVVMISMLLLGHVGRQPRLPLLGLPDRVKGSNPRR